MTAAAGGAPLAVTDASTPLAARQIDQDVPADRFVAAISRFGHRPIRPEVGRGSGQLEPLVRPPSRSGRSALQRLELSALGDAALAPAPARRDHGDPPESPGRVVGRARKPAGRCRGRARACPGPVLGQGAARHASSTYPSCCRRSSPATACSSCSAGGGARRVPGRDVRARLRLPLDRGRPGQRHHGLSPSRARDPALHRGGRPPARGRRRHARGLPGLGLSDRSRSRSSCPASSPAGSWPSRGAWASSGRRSRSSRTSQGKRRRCRRPSTPSPRSPAATRARSASPSSRSPSRPSPLLTSEFLARAVGRRVTAP